MDFVLQYADRTVSRWFCGLLKEVAGRVFIQTLCRNGYFKACVPRRSYGPSWCVRAGLSSPELRQRRERDECRSEHLSCDRWWERSCISRFFVDSKSIAWGQCDLGLIQGLLWSTWDFFLFQSSSISYFFLSPWCSYCFGCAASHHIGSICHVSK